jgi:hypothetical protein
MPDRDVTTSVSPRRAPRAHTRGTPVKGASRHSAAVAVPIAMFALVAASAMVAAYLAWPKLNAAANENTASVGEKHRLGVIVSESGNMRCVHATFDNATGQIAEKRVPCEATNVFDEHQAPVASGTIRTLNAISNSFR